MSPAVKELYDLVIEMQSEVLAGDLAPAKLRELASATDMLSQQGGPLPVPRPRPPTVGASAPAARASAAAAVSAGPWGDGGGDDAVDTYAAMMGAGGLELSRPEPVSAEAHVSTLTFEEESRGGGLLAAWGGLLGPGGAAASWDGRNGLRSAAGGKRVLVLVDPRPDSSDLRECVEALALGGVTGSASLVVVTTDAPAANNRLKKKLKPRGFSGALLSAQGAGGREWIQAYRVREHDRYEALLYVLAPDGSLLQQASGFDSRSVVLYAQKALAAASRK